MNANAFELLKKTIDSPWMTRVGDDILDGVDRASSWEEAYAFSSGKRVWEYATLEASNLLGLAVRSISRDEYRRWNDIVVEAGEVVNPFTQGVLTEILEERKLTKRYVKEFVDMVQWNLLGLATEAEYRYSIGLVDPSFYTTVADWYMKGHMPCGWNGKFPDGRLIVF